MPETVVINRNYAHVVTKLLGKHGLHPSVESTDMEVVVTCPNGLIARSVSDVLTPRGYRFSTVRNGPQIRFHITRRVTS